MSNYIEYENGQSKYGEFEIIRSSTADLFFANFAAGRAVEADDDLMAALVRGDKSIKNPAPKLPSYDEWFFNTYNRLPS